MLSNFLKISASQVLLYDWQLGYPWSKTSDGPRHPNIERVSNWHEVERSLARMAQALDRGADLASPGVRSAQSSGSYLP